MKAAVITFPGSNCDDDLIYTYERLAQFRVDHLWHKDQPDLSQYDLITLPGGFAYGDYLRCGAMAAQSPVMEKVKEAAGKGQLVLGICNGFQILCEAGLLPGALARNEHLRFVCKNVAMTVQRTDSPWTRTMKQGGTVTYPIAHGDGRYVVEPEEVPKLKERGQILLSYQENPNGSTDAIAGVCNEAKNVFGLMPHPERASDLGSKDGMQLWNSIAEFVKERTR